MGPLGSLSASLKGRHVSFLKRLLDFKAKRFYYANREFLHIFKTEFILKDTEDGTKRSHRHNNASPVSLHGARTFQGRTLRFVTKDGQCHRPPRWPLPGLHCARRTQRDPDVLLYQRAHSIPSLRAGTHSNSAHAFLDGRHKRICYCATATTTEMAMQRSTCVNKIQSNSRCLLRPC